MLTREKLLEMDEGTLREEVLIPLFKAMGFRDVYHYHGGSLEQGKDVVMWEEDKLGDRTNHAVVAKAVKVSGKVSARAGAGEIATQVLQCFGAEYRDPVTSEPRRIHQCWVVCSKEITKEAREATLSQLRNTVLERFVRFVDHDKLWELVRAHLPARVALQELSRVAKVFESASPDHRVVAVVRGDDVQLSLEPKQSRNDVAAPVIKTQFAFPDTPEGRAAREALENHIRTGAPVSIRSEFVKSLDLPAPIQSLFGSTLRDGVQIKLGPRSSEKRFLSRITVHPGNGNAASLEPFDLRVVRVGTEEITLSNAGQALPWHCELRVRTNNTIGFAFHVDHKNVNVKRELEGVSFQEAIAVGGTVSVADLDTGLVLFQFEATPRVVEAPATGLLDLLRRLVTIQTRTGVGLSLPEREFTLEDMRDVDRFSQLVETGRASVRLSNLCVTIDRAGITAMLGAVGHQDEGAYLRLPFAEPTTLFDTPMPLGEAYIVCNRVFPLAGDFERLRSELATSLAERDTFDVNFEMRADSEVYVEIPRFLPTASMATI